MSFSKEIIEIFDYLGEKLGIAIDWSSANAVPYLQELCGKYIKWEIATSIVWLVIGAILMLLCIPIWKKFKEAYARHEKRWSDDAYMGWFICFCCCIVVGTPIVLTQIFDIVKCIYLPELQVYEYIKYLIETHS